MPPPLPWKALARACAAGTVAALALGLVGVRASVPAGAPHVSALATAGVLGDAPAPQGEPFSVDADTDVVRVVPAAASRSRAAVRTLRWPYHGPITGPFGERRGGHIHPGMDISGHVGDRASAAAPGVVTVAGPAPSGYSGYGLLVVIDHGNGLQTMYAHLSRVAVSVGQQVETGDAVGAVGCSGSCTGPHLHFEVRLAGRPVNPLAFLG